MMIRNADVMKKILFAGCLLLVTAATYTQSIKVPPGKKITVSLNNTSTTTMSVMGQSVESLVVMNAVQEYTVQSVSQTGYTLLFVPKKISGSVSVMGQEQKFDSEDTTAKGSQPMEALNKLMNKPEHITVENGQPTFDGQINNTLSSIGMSSSDLLDFGKLFFFNLPDAQVKQGYSWSDSSVSENNRVVNQYVITDIHNGQVEVRVSTDSKIRTTVKQAGMELKEDMKGFSTALRVYANGLLVSEKVSLTMAGTAEIMGMSAPMTIVSTITTNVK